MIIMTLKSFIPAYVLILTSGSVTACVDYSIRIKMLKKIYIFLLLPVKKLFNI